MIVPLSILVFILFQIHTLFAKKLTFQDNTYYAAKCFPGTHSCELVQGKSKEQEPSSFSRAYGLYKDEVNVDGWGKLWLHGDDSTEGWYQAGFVEGALTSLRVYQHFTSWYSYQFGSSPPTQELIDWMNEQYDFATQLVASHPNEAYYERLGQVLAQFEGVLAGVNYAAAPGQGLSRIELLLLEASGDLYDILPALNTDYFKLKIGKLTKADFYDEWHRAVSCSALIKMTDDKSDVYAGHTTWTSYQNMLRIYKNYDLGAGVYQVSHSSKPGMVYSKDDFYVLPDKQLVVMETTNGVMNQELYKLVTTNSLLTWQRIPLTNSLVNNGKDWTEVFAKYNSGTYANQWMILDLKKFTPGSGPASSDFLWIIEVAPGLAVSQDVTSVFLSNGNYWPSVNIPYQKNVYVISGFEEAYLTYGDQYSYTNCSRSLIFARDESSCQTMDAMQKELRYNEYQTDPYSNGDPGNSISSRKDLRTSGAASSGGIDSKITSYSRIIAAEKNKGLGVATAESGPTHDTQPVFQWSTSQFNGQVHLGQPDVWNFSFSEMYFYEN